MSNSPHLPGPMRRFFEHCSDVVQSPIEENPIAGEDTFTNRTFTIRKGRWFGICYYITNELEVCEITCVGDNGYDIFPHTNRRCTTLPDRLRFWKKSLQEIVTEGRLTDLRKIALLTVLLNYTPHE